MDSPVGANDARILDIRLCFTRKSTYFPYFPHLAQSGTDVRYDFGCGKNEDPVIWRILTVNAGKTRRVGAIPSVSTTRRDNDRNEYPIIESKHP